MNKDGLFHQLDNTQAVLISGGVFRQVEVFNRNGSLYAAVAGGYVRLNGDGTTSKPKMSWDWLDMDGAELSLGTNGLGHLAIGDKATKPLPSYGTSRLIKTPDEKPALPKPREVKVEVEWEFHPGVVTPDHIKIPNRECYEALALDMIWRNIGHKITIEYGNHENKNEVRSIVPKKVFWGKTSFYPKSQFLVEARCLSRNADIVFAVDRIHGKIEVSK